MPRYLIGVKEVHVVKIETPDLENEEAAKEYANQQIEEGLEEEVEYSHTLDPDEWSVEEISSNAVRIAP